LSTYDRMVKISNFFNDNILMKSYTFVVRENLLFFSQIKTIKKNEKQFTKTTAMVESMIEVFKIFRMKNIEKKVLFNQKILNFFVIGSAKRN